MSISPTACLECGNALSASRQPERLFCCTPCRLAFNNRRMQRGAELYDLFRALRRERAEAKRLNIWTQICRLELAWQIDDDENAKAANRTCHRKEPSPICLTRALYSAAN